MKELSIEEKAHRYDEAIEIISDYYQKIRYSSLSCASNDIEVLEKAFPQLKESEGERIRKDIISHFAKGIEGSSFDEVREKYKIWIAWLEKQKDMEAKLIISDEGYNKAFQDGIEEVLTNPHKYRLEKQGEQKPSDKVEPKFKVGDTIRLKNGDGLEWTVEKVFNNGYYTIVCADRDDFILLDNNWELVEQKPAWSEEDEDILNTIINHFKIDIGCTDEDDMVRWLKSLKDRVQPQPKQEWSEKDEIMLNDIIKDLVNPWNEYIPDSIEEEIKWLKNKLKSLRPQPQWKPSDDEMKALAEALSLANNCGEESAFDLRTLYEQLKKLREE